MNYFVSMVDKASIECLRKWLSIQPHLPKNVPDVLLLKFLITSSGSIECAKELLDTFFTKRFNLPDLFLNRDLDDAEIQDTIEIYDMYKLSQKVNNNQIFVVRLKSNNLDKFHFGASLKTFLIYDDVQLCIDDEPYEGEICIIDMDQTSLKHLTKISVKQAKNMLEYIQEARPTNLKEIHLINTPTFIDKFLLLLRPFIKSELMNMIKFHSSIDSLYQHIPKEVLPKEYGGCDGTITSYKEEWDSKIRKYKYVIDGQSNWKVDENKRPVKNSCENKFGIQGSFRTLNID